MLMMIKPKDHNPEIEWHEVIISYNVFLEELENHKDMVSMGSLLEDLHQTIKQGTAPEA